MDRRDFAAAMASALMAAPVLSVGHRAVAHEAHELPDWMKDMRSRDETIILLAYPMMTALDLVGPQYMFANVLGAKTRLLAKTRDPVATDTGLTIVPDGTFSDCPAEPTIMFVPGGTTGTLAAILDAETLAFVASAGASARYLSSVCTGSMVLAAAGLLRGYRATSHWVTRDLLVHGGAIPVDERVVVDRNRWTGAGVSAGLDLGLALVAELRGRPYAEAVQLLAEYAPKPPFDAGTPATAGPSTTKLINDMFADFSQTLAKAVRDPLSR